MGYGVSLWGDEDVSTSIVVKAAQLVNALKLIESHTCKGGLHGMRILCSWNS